MDATWRRYTLAWLGGAGIGVANGVARELTYRKRVGELAAHQISTATAIGLFSGYFWALERRWPIETRKEALRIGAIWVGLTATFEFGFGHYVAKEEWSELLRDYDLARGRVWGLVLVWLGLGPLAVRELMRSSPRRKPG
jgi:hypothetical protein